MLLKSQRFIQIPLLGIVGFIFSGHAEEPLNSAISDEDILDFLEDPTILLGGADPTDAVISSELLPEKPSALLLMASLRAGIGHSDNFLKKYAELTTSGYTQIELDAIANWSFQQLDLNAMVFAEATLYDFELESSDETLAFAQLNGILRKGLYDFGFESSFLYGSFIYDSSLTAISVPSGTAIRQVMPTVTVFAHWYAPGSNRVRLALSGSRAEFNLDNQDYWDPGISLWLEHVWSPSFITSSKADLSRQLYDDDTGRTAGGEPLPGQESLSVDRLELSQELLWKPTRWKWLRIDLNLGMAWEDEDVGKYEAMRQSWIRGRMTLTNSWGRFKFSGKWGEYRYEDRLVSLYDPRLHLQTNQSLTIEYSRSLPWNLDLILQSQWNGLKSRIYQDTYSERRSQVLIQWSY